MKHYTSYVVTVFLLAIFLSLFFWLVHPLANNNGLEVFAPLPPSLAMLSNKQVTTLNLWIPEADAVASVIQKPDVQAKSAIVYDLTTDQTLFEKNTGERLPMASLTKVMTAIVAMENQRKDDLYKVTSSALVGEDSMGVTAGESYTMEELLYGLILVSGNDAAEVLADNFPLGRTEFIRAMNDKAKALGLLDTQFSNPSGLQGDGIQYTTVKDLLVITRFAILNFPFFTQVTQTPQYILPFTATHKEIYLENETNLLTTYPGVKGIKTGYTPEAGLCLITYLDYKGHKIIGVILDSHNRREDMKELLDYSLKSEGITPPPHP